MGKIKFKSRRVKLENKINDVLNKKGSTIEEILIIVDDYERDNLNTIEKLKKKKLVEMKLIMGGLKQCISAHGDITSQYITSASKRIYGALLLDEKLTKRNKYYNIIKLITTFLLLFLA